MLMWIEVCSPKPCLLPPPYLRHPASRAPQVVHFMRVSKTMSRLVGAMWDIFFEIAAICILVFVLVVAFATCMTVSMGHNDLLFATFGTSGAPQCMRDGVT